MKICFVQHAGEFPLMESIAKELKKYDVEMVFVCKSPDAHKQYREAGFESYLISTIFNQETSLTNLDLEEIDKKYGLPGIQAINDSDVHMQALFGNDDRAKRQIIGRAYKFWEKFFTENKIDYVLSRDIAMFATRTAYKVSRFLDIPSSQLAVGPGKEFFILSDMGKTSMWSELEAYVATGKIDISESQKKEVMDFVNRRLPKVQGLMKLYFVEFSFWKGVRQLLGLYRRDTAALMQEDPIGVASLRYGRKLLARRIIWKYLIGHFFNYDEVGGERFAYFPLYSGNETGYLTDDHYWAKNQFSLIVEVAKSLPIGVQLYIKEHPSNPGILSWREMRELKKLSNIKVLRPSISSQLLIDKSDFTFVLQGTAGWEAFLSRKPVVSLGTSFFSYSDLVYKISNISSISSVLDEVFTKGEKIYDENNNDWLWFINGVITTCGQGEVLNLTPPPDFPTSEENASKIASFINNKVKKDLDS